jgi:hypothetical protein
MAQVTFLAHISPIFCKTQANGGPNRGVLQSGSIGGESLKIAHFGDNYGLFAKIEHS